MKKVLTGTRAWKQTTNSQWQIFLILVYAQGHNLSKAKWNVCLARPGPWTSMLLWYWCQNDPTFKKNILICFLAESSRRISYFQKCQTFKYIFRPYRDEAPRSLFVILSVISELYVTAGIRCLFVHRRKTTVTPLDALFFINCRMSVQTLKEWDGGVWDEAWGGHVVCVRCFIFWLWVSFCSVECEKWCNVCGPERWHEWCVVLLYRLVWLECMDVWMDRWGHISMPRVVIHSH